MKVKYAFIISWILLLLFPVFVVVNRTPHFVESLKYPIFLLNFAQRVFGLMAFVLLPVQITLGAFMTRIAEKYGSWIYWIHVTQAILIYGLVLFHPITYVLFTWKAEGILDPFRVFTDVCLLCPTRQDLMLTFGRFAFFFITWAYFAAKYRTHDVLRKYWRVFHYLNYLAFFMIVLHAKSLGSDIHSVYFYWYFWLAIIVVSGMVIYKVFRFLKSFVKIPS